jgi:hypothetical protein
MPFARLFYMPCMVEQFIPFFPTGNALSESLSPFLATLIPLVHFLPSSNLVEIHLMQRKKLIW